MDTSRQTLQEAMLEALKTVEPPRPGIIERLVRGLRALGPDGGPVVQERRRFGRLDCEFPTSCALEHQGSVSARVIELSPGGVRLATDRKLSLGTAVAINPPDGADIEPDYGPVMCRVLWCKKNGDDGHQVGLAYDGSALDLAASWVAALLASLGYGEELEQKRKHVRAEAEIPVAIRIRSSERAQGVALNLGMGGTLLYSDTELPVDTKLSLALGPLDGQPILTLAGEVLSNRPTKEGEAWLHSVRFLTPDPAQHKMLATYVLSLLRG